MPTVNPPATNTNPPRNFTVEPCKATQANTMPTGCGRGGERGKWVGREKGGCGVRDRRRRRRRRKGGGDVRMRISTKAV